MITSPYSLSVKQHYRRLAIAGLMFLGILVASIQASAQNPLLPADSKAWDNFTTH